MECIRSEKCHFCHSQRFMISKETEHVLMPRFSYLMLLARQITKPTILGQKPEVTDEVKTLCGQGTLYQPYILYVYCVRIYCG